MPKIKKHSGTAKVVGKNGKIGHPGTRHNTGKKNASVNRKNRKGSTLSKADQNRLREII